MPILNEVLYFCVINLLHSKQVSLYRSIFCLNLCPKTTKIQRDVLAAAKQFDYIRRKGK